MGLVVASDWHNTGVMRSIRFEDDNTRSWWMPVSAGANVPSLNALLKPHGIALGNLVVSGLVRAHRSVFRFESGNGLVEFPAGGEVLYARGMVVHNQNDGRDGAPSLRTGAQTVDVAVLGITRAGLGAVAVYGDTNCIDTAYNGDVCHEMFVSVIRHVVELHKTAGAQPKLLAESTIVERGIRQTKADVGREAATPQSRFVELMRPHSRTLSPTRQAGGTLDFRDTAALCPVRLARVVPVAVRTEGAFADAPVSFPAVRYSDPVGSTANYYSPAAAHSSPSIWMFLSRLNGRQGVPHVRSLFRGGPGTRREVLWSSKTSALCGALLILLSLLTRCATARRSGTPKMSRRRRLSLCKSEASGGHPGHWLPFGAAGSRGPTASSSTSSSSGATLVSSGSLKYPGRWR
jgi:hypothetical protein